MSAIGTKMKSCAVAMLVIGGTLQTSALPSRLAMPSDIRFEGIETGNPHSTSVEIANHAKFAVAISRVVPCCGAEASIAPMRIEPGGTATLTGRLSSMQIPSEQSNNPDNQKIRRFFWNYLPGSDLKSSLAYPNGLTAYWTYDANNQLLQVCNATSTNTISQYDYTYDAAGRRVACGKSGSAFAQNDIVDYGYNNRSELTNAVAAIDADYRYSYAFDDIGNRETSFERGTNSVYTANQLNQYTEIFDSALSASPRETFTPTYDDDGNQTLVKTATGIWHVTYNGENRPVLWENVSTTSPTPNSSTPTLISMSYDRMGRRVTKNNRRFVYVGYLQIADNSGNVYIWDPMENVATRPIVWKHGNYVMYYNHDGNKNVSEVIAFDGALDAHYEYAPFGVVAAQSGTFAALNPWRFSSEFAEDDTATVYYNYRHYEPVMGRWLSRDVLNEMGCIYAYLWNKACLDFDILGNSPWDDFIKSLSSLIKAWNAVKSAYDAYSKCVETTMDWMTNFQSKQLNVVNDKMIHCWASCAIGEDCGSKFAIFAGIVKEFGDILGAMENWFLSVVQSLPWGAGTFIIGGTDVSQLLDSYEEIVSASEEYIKDLEDSSFDEDADMWGVECFKNGEDCECCCGSRYSRHY